MLKKICKVKKGKGQAPKAPVRSTSEGSQKERDQDQDKQPKERDIQDRKDGDLVSKMTARSMDTQDTMEYEPYDGAYSQWREEDETNWDKYQWPPVGWRPNRWNQCYWDYTSRWHAYNTYDWDAYHAQQTPWEDGPKSPDVSTPAKTTVESESTSPPVTIASSEGSYSRSSSVDALASQLQRAWTGDLVDQASGVPVRGPTGPNLGVVNAKESEVQKHPGQGDNEGKKDEGKKDEGKKDEGKEEKGDKESAGELEKKQSEEKPKEGDNKENAKEGGKEEKPKEGDKAAVMEVENKQEQPGGSGGAPEQQSQPAENAEDEAEKARLKELEEKAKAAHARYMRYFRNVRSINLSRWSSQYMWITCMHAYLFLGPMMSYVASLVCIAHVRMC